MRGLKTTVGLLVVLGGLFAYIYFVTWKQPAEDASSKLEKVFAGLQSDKIDEIHVHSESGDSTVLKKDADGWKITEPLAAAAQESEASGIASALSQLEVARVVDENPASLVDYGLGAPRIEIQFKAAGDKDLKTLQIGQKTPAGGNLFAKRGADKRVFTIQSFQEQTFNRSTFDLRDKTAIKFDRDKVDGIEMTADNKTLQLSKSGGDWKIVKPVQALSDTTATEGLIGKVQSAQMKSIVTENASAADLKKYGLDKPAATVTFGLGSAKASLLVGGKSSDGSLYARDASKPLVMTVDATLLDDFKKGADEYRRKDLFAFRAYDANRIEITRGGQTIAFDKIKGAKPEDEDKWQRAGSGGGKAVDADKEKMSVLLAKLESVRATSFVDSAAKTGLDSPAMTVYAKFDDGKKEERVTFGKSGNDVYAGRPGEPGAAKVSPTEFDDINKKLDELAK
jgi:predicted negative regulator of RcsB-dependent stress response